MSKSGNKRKNSASSSSTPLLTKEQVQSQMKDGDLIVMPRTGSSDIWKRFQAVVDKKSLQEVGFVVCTTCNRVYSYKKGSSPSTLKAHKCNLEEHRTQSSHSAHPQMKDVPQERKTVVTERFVEMCGRDLRPFQIVSGVGFQNVLQEFVNLGAAYGPVDVKTVIPHPTTISRNVSKIADKIRIEMLPEVTNALSAGFLALDSDLWTDKPTKTHYLTATSQHINEEWKLRCNVLFTTEFPAEESKTGINIRNEIQDQMSAIGFDSFDLHKATFVTDQGPNIKLALADLNRIPCLAHLLATVLRHTLDEEKFLKFEAPETQQCILTARNVVGYMKRSGLCKALSETVKQMIEVRWNTVIDMLQSMCSTFDEIVEVLTKQGKIDKIKNWNGELVTDLITFLSKFKEVSVELQAKKVPTLHLVLVRYHELLRHCQVDDEECHLEMPILKKRAESFLKSKIEITDFHYAASFLCPNIRHLKLLSEEERLQAHSAVERLYEKLSSATGNSIVEEIIDTGDASPANKKSRFGEWGSAEEADNELSFSEEQKLYLSIGKANNEDPKYLLPWWKSRQATFPKLAKVARKVLGIRATSASSERNFSRAGLIVTDKRNQISPEAVNDLLVIHNFYLGQVEEDQEIQHDQP